MTIKGKEELATDFKAAETFAEKEYAAEKFLSANGVRTPSFSETLAGLHVVLAWMGFDKEEKAIFARIHAIAIADVMEANDAEQDTLGDPFGIVL